LRRSRAIAGRNAPVPSWLRRSADPESA
jgi:hypothetical protein